MAKFKIFRAPRFCPQARAMGYDDCKVIVGDLIIYEENYTDGTTGRRLAKVLGLADGPLPDGSDPGDDTLVVLVVDEMITHAYERYVKLGDVQRIRTPHASRFAQWFLQGPAPRPQTAIDVVKYGAMNERYLDKYLEEDGTIPADWRERDRVAG